MGQASWNRIRNGWGNWLGHVFHRTPVSHDPVELFARFQAVLTTNNRSLEIITDLGEKLSGAYLFDVNYTKTAYTELFEAISESLENFIRLTGDANLVLAETLDRINRQVQRVLSEAGPESEPLIFLYPDITWDTAEVVGGKNYHLALLGNELHLKIPKAFAVTTRAFELFLAHNQLNEQRQALAVSQDTDKDLAELRRAVLNGSIPEEFTDALEQAVCKLTGRNRSGYQLAVRSSAEEEDGEFSFAGQFDSELNVPATAKAVGAAWRRVAASLFTERAAAYQQQLGYDLGRLRMATACVAMIPAKVSGVIYTMAGPQNEDSLIINASWGLGPAVVDGITDADFYLVRKCDPPVISESRTGRKEVMVVEDGSAGIKTTPTPMEQRQQPCLSENQVLALTRQAMLIEKFFRVPQDIEWAIDDRGEIFILQSRTLKIDQEANPSPTGSTGPITENPDLPVLMKNQGIVVRQGVAAGRVFMIRNQEDLEQVPRGSVLVAPHDSPQYVRVIPFINAIITDTGVATSHMASICREFEVPTVVNTGNATELLAAGDDVTLQADSDGKATVYAGIAHDLLLEAQQMSGRMNQLYEYRRQKYLMRYIAPLHLVNPLEDNFSPEKCRSIHDLIRFMHEMSVQALVAGAVKQAKGITGLLFGRKKTIQELELPLPIHMLVIDIGGALAGTGRKARLEQIHSRPLRAILQGMLQPGVWNDETMPLTGKDFLAGMTRTADPGQLSAGGANLAVASAEYVNLSLRFGYHFNMLDCYCTDQPRNNHIFFRFVGGAAAITNRSLRITFIERVLESYGFLTKAQGDLLVARTSNLPGTEVESILVNIGRLIGFARQIDAAMVSVEVAERLAADFLAGQLPNLR